ncbi:hypothetical protein EYZ11_010193 [Aspergillus tanneri]|uniref:Uncharacterized protein n=1 Tax=Aspergillus tanneri TaxID=1220188 RepID=A0A4S3J5Z3_9EURO|nr:hypothetical protein EYZ11_010193 [Aspergillus tanneri]
MTITTSGDVNYRAITHVTGIHLKSPANYISDF